ncbi:MULTISPECIES: alpha/beta hydrolase [unclassified Amycolatopsis]|uniref:alpha/beta fold hydrolase n=1 Tax=unclassified Amycolatopsis TaxID=2618356 RepID=UPI002875E668|nr:MULTISPECIES: alpha/beta hydrolase [unclassified Amycolatopsis]MDS0136363.1 alpha/beta hydrolase [Amycolatopsis sp. 505]MDS0145878.1 alpha/beta hydrolase [Amycolatopsis sp. CM201R]
MPEVTLGDAVVHYDRTGDGPALLLLHGTAASREQWGPLTGQAGGFTVLAPDFPGSGLTTDSGGPITVEALAAQAAAVLDDAGFETAHVVGHSLGAVVAAHLAGTRPDRVRTAVLHAAWPATDVRQDAEFRYWLDLLGTGTFARMLPLMAFGPRYWEQATAESNDQLVKTLETVIQPGADRQIEADRAVDLRPVLGRITAPVLVLGSAHDRIVTADQQRELVAAIPDARAAEIDAGHGAPAELPNEFARLVLDFVRSAP